LSATIGEDVPRSFIVGETVTAGHRIYHNAWSGSATPNNHYVQVFSIGDVPIDSMTGLLKNKRSVTVDWNSASSKGYPVTEDRDPDTGRDNTWVFFYDGTQTTAPSYLTSKFGSHPKYPWTSKMVGTGIPLIIVTSRLHPKFFDGSRIDWLFKVKGMSLYDVRLDSTEGGSGTHRRGTESTYEYFEDPATIANNVIGGITYNGQWVYGGQNVGPAQTPPSKWMAAANKGDETVSLKDGGTQKRFVVGAEISVDTEPMRVLAELTKSGNGRLSEVGGAYIPTFGSPGSSVYSFTEDDVIVSETSSANMFPGLQETYNGIKVSYPEPGKGWETKSFTRTNSTFETEDGGRRLIANLELPYLSEKRRAQRVAKAALLEQRRFITLTLWLPPDSISVLPGEIVDFTSASDKWAYTAKKFRVVSKGLSPSFNQLFLLKEMDPADLDDWTPATDEVDYTPVTLTPVETPTQTINSPSATASSILDAASNERRPSVLVTWEADAASAADLDDVNGVRIKIALKSSGAIVLNQILPNWEEGTANLGNPALIANETYEVSLLYVTNSGRDMTWAGPIDVTMKDIRTGFVDFDVAVNNARTYANTTLREVMDEVDRIASGAASQDLSNFLDKQTLREELRSETDTVKADYTSQIDVATSDIEALSQENTQFKVALGGGEAYINVQYKALATQAGFAARYGIVLGADDGQLRPAAFIIDVPIDPLQPSQITLLADQTLMQDASGNAIAMFAGGEINAAVIPNLVAEKIVSGLLSSVDGLSFWNLDTGAFRNST
jgi:Putative phage tail protein